MIKAVLFDLDGTLVDSMSDLKSAVNFALSELNFPKVPDADFPALIGNGNRYLLTCALPENKRTDENINKALKLFFTYYAEHCAVDTYVYKDVLNLLNNLKENGIKTAVITNKAQSMTNCVINNLFKGFTFNAVYGQRDLIPVKPNPESAYLALEVLGVTKDECLFVGDSKNDMLAGKNAGIKPIGVLWGYRNYNELTENGAYKTVNNPMQILDIIKTLK